MQHWDNNEPFLANSNHAKVLGVVFLVLGVACLYDAYEGRGQSSPFWVKFLPGL